MKPWIVIPHILQKPDHEDNKHVHPVLCSPSTAESRPSQRALSKTKMFHEWQRGWMFYQRFLSLSSGANKTSNDSENVPNLNRSSGIDSTLKVARLNMSGQGEFCRLNNIRRADVDFSVTIGYLKIKHIYCCHLRSWFRNWCGEKHGQTYASNTHPPDPYWKTELQTIWEIVGDVANLRHVRTDRRQPLFRSILTYEEWSEKSM